MCDKNSSLNKAILVQVKEFATNNTTFSIHDITRGLREKTSKGVIDIPELKSQNSQFSHEIPHITVKSAFTELLNDNIFSTDLGLDLNRNYNGTYFEYVPVVVSPSSSTPTTNTTTLTPTVSSVKTLSDRIKIYLSKWDTGSFLSVKQVQSGIRRHNIPDTKCIDIQSEIANIGYKMLINPSYPSLTTILM